MRNRTSCFLLAFPLALAFVPGHLLAQETLINNNGRQVPCEVKGISAGQLDYVDTRDKLGTVKHMPCNEVAAVVDGSLMLNTDPCATPLAAKPANCKRNCESLVMEHNTVIKGNITRWNDEGYVVLTRTAELTLPRGDVLGVVSGNGVEFSLPADGLRKLMGDQAVIQAINNTGQCPDAAPAKPVAYAGKYAKQRFDAAKLNNPVLTPKLKTGTPADTVQRGLLAVLDFDTFKTLAMEKTERLRGYIKQISDKTLSELVRDRAVDQAITLFERPDCIVHVSNVKTGIDKQYPVRIYLGTNLRKFKYDRVDIEWADLNYASNFEMQPDSSYKMVISLQQRFVGYIDNKPYYSDVTNKNVTVTLRRYEKVREGRMERLWDVFLSDIGVTSTKAG